MILWPGHFLKSYSQEPDVFKKDEVIRDSILQQGREQKVESRWAVRPSLGVSFKWTDGPQQEWAQPALLCWGHRGM